MRYLGIVAAVAVCLAVAGTAGAATATWDVATVHGVEQFAIESGGTSLLYDRQPWTNYVWYNNNGSPPGVVATTTAGPHAPAVEPRSGMRTFAVTDVAVGRALDATKLQFSWLTALGNPTVNYFLTDGHGHNGIFAPTSLGISAITTVTQTDGWTTWTINLTSGIPDSTSLAVYEQNGLTSPAGVPYTTMTWGDIKNMTIAGFYDYERSPEGGWGAWGSCFDNQHGIALIWGDTANSNNAYGSHEVEIKDVTVSFGGTDYAGTFVDSTVPEPLTMAGLLLGIGSVVGYARKRRMA